MTPRPEGTVAGPPDDETIACELAGLAARDPRLFQFRSLASAYQYRRLYRLVRRHVPPGAQVLDWGAGWGHFSYFLLRAGYRACGYSFEEPILGGWLDGAGYRHVQGHPRDPVTLPFPDATFDAVTSVGVLEHVRETGGDEAASLGEIARVLRPGGVFVCFHLPNRPSLIDAVARLTGRAFHAHRYRRGDIVRLLAGARLRLVEIGRYGALPRNACGGLPGMLQRSRAFARGWDVADVLLGACLRPVCQNWCFVARKPPPGRDHG